MLPNELSQVNEKVNLIKKINRLERSLFVHDKFLYQHPSVWLYYYTNLTINYYRLGEKQCARRLARTIFRKSWYYIRLWSIVLYFEWKSIQDR